MRADELKGAPMQDASQTTPSRVEAGVDGATPHRYARACS